ncbi:hypothetical protein diail_11601 [Diaporthe ilicicola]|nr:hypothetical protein diail_11601 [Diaporthe ilicicola]
MAWLSILSTDGVLLSTCLGYLVHVVYSHRRKINELRKQGVVSDPNPSIDGVPVFLLIQLRPTARANRMELDHRPPTRAPEVRGRHPARCGRRVRYAGSLPGVFRHRDVPYGLLAGVSSSVHSLWAWVDQPVL